MYISWVRLFFWGGLRERKTPLWWERGARLRALQFGEQGEKGFQRRPTSQIFVYLKMCFAWVGISGKKGMCNKDLEQVKQTLAHVIEASHG